MKLHKTTKNHLPTPLLHKHTSRQVIALTVTINPSLTKIEPLTSAQFRTNKSSPPIQHTSITILPPFVTHSMYMTLHTGVHKTSSGFPVCLYGADKYVCSWNRLPSLPTTREMKYNYNEIFSIHYMHTRQSIDNFMYSRKYSEIIICKYMTIKFWDLGIHISILQILLYAGI